MKEILESIQCWMESLVQITMKDVKTAESKLGLKFHKDYIDMILKYDGWYEKDGLVISGLTGNNTKQVEDIVYLNTTTENYKNLPKGHMYISYENKWEKSIVMDNTTGQLYLDYNGKLKNLNIKFKELLK